MTPEQREQILQALWPQGAKSTLGVWAILDCARDPKIYLAMLESKLEFRCLYSGKLPRELEMVAPHLVELSPTNRLIGRWLDEGWGQAWGVMLKIGDPSNLRHHLRKFLKVQDEAGRTLIFRYYDPRVLREYLPSCRGDELRQLFGPIDRFIVEDRAATNGMEFAFVGGALKQSPLRIGKP
jgi:hypothetical protein